MKPPKIPFMPLLLKDVTFIHEGNKTFLDNLVNFEKLVCKFHYFSLFPPIRKVYAFLSCSKKQMV